MLGAALSGAKLRRPSRILVLGFLIALAAAIAGHGLLPGSEKATGGGNVTAEIAKAPLSFEPNAGRAGRSVDYIAHSVAGGTLSLSARQAVLVLPTGNHRSQDLGLVLAGGNPHASAVALAPLAGKANVFIGDDPSKWRSGIPTYGRIRYQGVYPGINLDWYGNQHRLEYDFRLAPRADSSQIGLNLRGADSVRIASNGELVVDVGRREIRQAAPVAFQTIGGRRHEITAAYDLHGSRVGFRLGTYDRSQPLVIDPLVLDYSTYLGGGGTVNGDFGLGIAVDSAGAAYVTGETDSGGTPFPTQDAFQASHGGGNTDAFVTKFNPDTGGTVGLAYSTYLGGGGDDVGRGIAVDSAGAAYVVGDTASAGGTPFPTDNPFQGSNGGGLNDAFVTKLNPDAGGIVSLAYSSYLGGGGADEGSGIAVDSAGAAYLTGDTSSTGGLPFPTQDPFQMTNAGGIDAFAAKINPDTGGTMSLAYSTYLGGAGTDQTVGGGIQGGGIAVDSAGAAYLTGVSDSTGVTHFPTLDPYQGANAGGADVYVTKLNPDAGGTVSLAYSTYLGGAGTDSGHGIAVDSAGAAYVTGDTDSSGVTPFPTQDAFQATYQGGNPDAFVTKLNPDTGGAASLAYSTYLGGGSFDTGNGIAVDSSGAAYVTGKTHSIGVTAFPTKNAFQDTEQDGGAAGDAYVTKFAPDTGGAVSLAYSTYLGGGHNDGGRAIAVDSAGAAYLTGFTLSSAANPPPFPTQDAFQPTRAPNADAFVAKLVLPQSTTVSPPPATPSATGQRAAALKKCKKKKSKKARKKCKKKANQLPV
jgi:hypothetical protein